jgi:hypothetical protein
MLLSGSGLYDKSFDYMTPELLNLYQELAKIGGDFVRYPNRPRLHLIIINAPMINIINEFGVPELRGELLLNQFGTENSQQSL